MPDQDEDETARLSTDDPGEAIEVDRRHWFLQGLRRVISVPAAALAGGFVGYGALLHDFGWPVWAAVLSCVLIFAGPAQFVLAGALAAGTGLLGACLAASLSSVRLLPMVVSVMPQLRSDPPSRPLEFAAAHLTAITTWVEMLHRLPGTPRNARLPLYLGLGIGLLIASSSATAAGFFLAELLPRVLGLELLAITPIYFLLSLVRGARGTPEKVALLLGLVLAPTVFAVAPGFELLVSGLVGGTAAFFVQRRAAARTAPP